MNVVSLLKNCFLCQWLCCQVWLSGDGGNFFTKLYKFESPHDRPPLFSAGYRYETGIWAVLTHNTNADDRMLCVGKTG